LERKYALRMCWEVKLEIHPFENAHVTNLKNLVNSSFFFLVSCCGVRIGRRK
jgi:hypothetical protein